MRIKLAFLHSKHFSWFSHQMNHFILKRKKRERERELESVWGRERQQTKCCCIVKCAQLHLSTRHTNNDHHWFSFSFAFVSHLIFAALVHRLSCVFFLHSHRFVIYLTHSFSRPCFFIWTQRGSNLFQVDCVLFCCQCTLYTLNTYTLHNFHSTSVLPPTKAVTISVVCLVFLPSFCSCVFSFFFSFFFCFYYYYFGIL